MNKLSILFYILVLPYCCSAQWLTGVTTKWNDSFVEWTLFAEAADDEEEEMEGDLQLRWPSRNDWTEWTYDIGDENGSIKQTFKNRPGQWDIRGFGKTITARTRWNNDFSEWRITDNSTTLIFKSRWRNNINEWSLNDETHGSFALRTEWDDDPREWRVYDDLDEEISMPMKMAMVFIAIYHSSPKQ